MCKSSLYSHEFTIKMQAHMLTSALFTTGRISEITYKLHSQSECCVDDGPLVGFHQIFNLQQSTGYYNAIPHKLFDAFERVECCSFIWGRGGGAE